MNCWRSYTSPGWSDLETPPQSRPRSWDSLNRLQRSAAILYVLSPYLDGRTGFFIVKKYLTARIDGFIFRQSFRVCLVIIEDRFYEDVLSNCFKSSRYC